MSTCPRCGSLVKNLHYHEPEVCDARIDAYSRHPEPQLKLAAVEQCPGQLSLLDENPQS